MVKPITQLNTQLTSNLTNTVKELHHSLQAIQPTDNKTAQLITYLLIGTAITGIMVYHYIRNQENLD
jgi:hypothetical protein